MEILSNFASIYCYISFVIGAVLMLVALAIAAMGKDYEPRNKVRFYVTCETNYRGEIIRTLWLGKPYYTKDKRFGVNEDEYANLKWEDEPVEVFLNMED